VGVVLVQKQAMSLRRWRLYPPCGHPSWQGLLLDVDGRVLACRAKIQDIEVFRSKELAGVDLVARDLISDDTERFDLSDVGVRQRARVIPLNNDLS
jgi:hypothetical protein